MNLLNTFFNIPVFLNSLPQLLWGLVVTLQIGITSILVGLAGGLFLAVARLYAPSFFQALIRIYIDIFRSIPLLVLLIVVYYALPFVGIRLSPFLSAVTALSLVSAAYTAEIFRADIEAIPSGQFEASSALGLSGRSTMMDIILPQAIRIVIPPLTNNCINVMKDTALASVVAMPDLLKQATQAQALNANPTPLIGAALIYIALLCLWWPSLRVSKSITAGGNADGEDNRPSDLDPPPEQGLWHIHRSPRYRSRCGRRRSGLHHRPLRLRQIDADPLHQPPRSLLAGKHHHR